MAPRVYYLKFDVGRLLEDIPESRIEEVKSWTLKVNQKAAELHCGKNEIMSKAADMDADGIVYMFADGNNAFAFMQWLADETERLGALAHMSLGVLPSDYPAKGKPAKAKKKKA
jgi:hypothetical protein